VSVFHPRVSIVTATRNRPHLLRQALLSIKRQSLEGFEAIVVDDGSSVETHEQYRRLWLELDERFTLHHASPPGGPGSDPGRGRNYGVRQATGAVVAFLDHDDVWHDSEHLAVGVHALLETGGDYYFTHVQFEPAHADLMWVVAPSALTTCPRAPMEPVVHDVPVDRFLEVMRHSHIHPSHAMVRRELFDRAGGFIEGLRTADDVNLMLRLADCGPRIRYRPEAVVTMRLPEGKSFSLSSSELDQSLAERHAMLDVRTRCTTAAVRQCARAREAWVLRQIAAQLFTQGRAEALWLAWEAVAVLPSPGTAWFFAKSLARVLGRAPSAPR
jgi:glycosyltransferase involved in cell wall biosynthesis